VWLSTIIAVVAMANQHFGDDPVTVMPDLLHATKYNQLTNFLRKTGPWAWSKRRRLCSFE